MISCGLAFASSNWIYITSTEELKLLIAGALPHRVSTSFWIAWERPHFLKTMCTARALLDVHQASAVYQRRTNNPLKICWQRLQIGWERLRMNLYSYILMATCNYLKISKLAYWLSKSRKYLVTSGFFARQIERYLESSIWCFVSSLS